MTSFLCRALIGVLLIYASTPQQESTDHERPPIPLPTSKMLTVPSPGRIVSTNSFPATMVLSPDGHFAALLNDGYGTQETLAHQSIAILNLDTNKVADFPDARLGDDAHQSYFIGLAFSLDGKHLYASVGSLTTLPPSSTALAAMASASSTPNVTLQCAGVAVS